MARIQFARDRREYSIAEARNNLSGLVHRVESDDVVELTRHGRPVAVLLSKEKFDRLVRPQKRFSETLRGFRLEEGVEELGIDRDTFRDVRAADRGRDIAL